MWGVTTAPDMLRSGSFTLSGSTGSVTSRAQRRRPARTCLRRVLRSIKPPRAMLMTVAPSGRAARFLGPESHEFHRSVPRSGPADALGTGVL